MYYPYYRRHPNGGGSIGSDVQVDESVYLDENVVVSGGAQIYGSVRLLGSAQIHRSVRIYGLYEDEPVEIGGSAQVCGSVVIVGNVYVGGRSYIESGTIIYNPDRFRRSYIIDSEVTGTVVLGPSEIDGAILRNCILEDSSVAKGVVLQNVNCRNVDIPAIHGLLPYPVYPNGPGTLQVADWTLSMGSVRGWTRQISDDLVVADLKRWKKSIHRFFRSWFILNQDRIWAVQSDRLQNLRNEILQKLPMETSA